MSKIGYIYDPIMEEHCPPEDHVENPDRIKMIYQHLTEKVDDLKLEHIASRLATREELLLAHNQEYLNKICNKLKRIKKPVSPFMTDVDLYASSGTLRASLCAVGSVLNLVETVMAGEDEDQKEKSGEGKGLGISCGFAIVRPPGHHAGLGRCEGFCFFNNVAISALKLARELGKKVLIVDWDVHHGNGTENILRAKFKEDENLEELIKFFSIHRYDKGLFYPGTGRSSCDWNIFNYGFSGSQGDEYYLNRFKNQLVPWALRDGWEPDLILVSCGFDAYLGDPLGMCQVSCEGYYQMTKILREVCDRVVMVLEGGYKLEGLGYCVEACIRGLED